MALTNRVLRSCLVRTEGCSEPLQCSARRSFSSASCRTPIVAVSELRGRQTCSVTRSSCWARELVVEREGFLVGRRLSSFSPSPAAATLGRRRRGSMKLLITARRGFLRELESIRDEKNLAGPFEFEAPLQVILYPDPRLRAKNKRINVFDDNLQRFVKEMLDAMYRFDGVGLSAPQVGVNVQLMVYNPVGERGKGKEYVLINPKITKYAASTDVEEEGCLSFPGIAADVVRPMGVKVDAQDEKGRKFSIALKGWQARIFQHEYDHLEGILFHDRMSAGMVQKVVPQLKELEQLYASQFGVAPPEVVEKAVGAGKA